MSDTHFTRVEKLMGNRFELCLLAENQENANRGLDAAVAEIKRIEALLSTFREDSQTNEINRNAGIMPVKVDKEVFDLIFRSVKISDLTDGAFDITYGGLDTTLWNFDTKMKSLPDSETAKNMIQNIGYQKIKLDPANQTVILKDKGMRIGFGGIGKGYAADKAKWLMQQMGFKAGYVNASGDLVTWGKQAGGKDWTIGITNPEEKSENIGTVTISDLAIATSGNYEKFVVLDGKRYSHTIDPKTGLPVSGIKSVSIITRNAELADAMATPVTVLGVKNGLELINQIKDMECIIIDDFNTIFFSDNLKIKK